MSPDKIPTAQINCWPVFTSATTAWLQLVERLLKNSVFRSAPRGLPIYEDLCVSSSFDMRYPIVNVKSRKLSYRFMYAEAWFILSAKNDVESIAKYNAKIAAFSDDGLTFFGAYGPQVVPQLSYIVEKLIQDPETRQAVAVIFIRQPRTTKDVPCTVAVQWVIRNGTIHCHDFMRSSDAWLGWPYDVFNFTMMTYWVMLRIFELSGVAYKVGVLTLTATSQHLYEKDADAAREVLADPAQHFQPHAPWSPFLFGETPTDLVKRLKEKADELLENPGAPVV